MAEKKTGMTFDVIMRNLKSRKFAPVYFLMGEEAYFIDKISDYIADNVLPVEERDFNQSIVYGTDYTMVQVVDMARRYPMMSEYQVVIVKEAQNLRDFSALEKYAATQVMPTTILVICYKNGSLDRKRKGVASLLSKIEAAGGIVFRPTADNKDIEILLIQDSKNRWTIPKGHIEPGETAKVTARREIEEETGLANISVLTWLGKIHFKYRRLDKLVLMTTQVYLVQALDNHETPTPEKWMKGIRWFSFTDALEAIEYEDIEKLMLIAKKKIRAGDYK